MLTESGVEVEDKPLEIAEGTEFSRYRDTGGGLPEGAYKKALEALEKKTEEGQPFGEPIHRIQALGYAKSLGLKLTPKQVFLYCFLLESRIPLPSDQKAVAEALLITKDLEQYLKLSSARPNIFRKQAA